MICKFRFTTESRWYDDRSAYLLDNSAGAGSPALSFGGDTDTGMFRKVAEVIP